MKTTKHPNRNRSVLTVREMTALYKSGQGITEISKQAGITYSGVRHSLLRAGVLPNKVLSFSVPRESINTVTLVMDALNATRISK